jgi:hypothetical protein
LSSRGPNLEPIYGQPLTTSQLQDSAIAAFDEALEHGADSARIVSLARIGKGRALLNQGRYADAAQAVAAVPTDYVYNVNFSGESSLGDAGINGFFSFGQYTLNVTIPERDGGNGINWRTANDPRVVLIRRDDVTDGDTIYGYVPYQSETAPIPMATGVEARLIEAEAALQSGDIAGWLAIHNTLRLRVSGLAPLVDPGTADGRVDLHFRERAFWLFLTGTRLGDLRRLVRQYGRDTESVFPTGVWRDGIPYGPVTNMAVPQTERLNPNFSGCLNRDA